MRFLQRLASGRAWGASTGNTSSQIESVRDNIQWIFNTRQGDSCSSPEYGLPDLTTVIAGLPSTEEPFCEALASSIRKHEPRISYVDVKLDDADSRYSKTVRRFTVVVVLKSERRRRRQLSGSVDMDAAFTLFR